MKTLNHPWQIILWAILVLLLRLSLQVEVAQAAGPKQQAGQIGSEIIGLASDPLDCLTIDLSGQASGVVHLTWQGQPNRARLIINIAGSEAAHTIKVNGQAVAQTPIQPHGHACGEGESFYLEIPPGVIVQGENAVELTNDALPGDIWSAAEVRIEVLGPITVAAGDQVGSADVSTLATPVTISFTNELDGTTQQARRQLPDNYDGTPRPLLVFIHPRSADMFFGESRFGSETNARGWLLISPELHGRWPGPNPDPPIPPGKFAYASPESQYDALGAVKYMASNYNVDPERIYIAGYSMGAQGVLVTAAKSPHVFAAAFDNKGPSNMYDWYYEQLTYYISVSEAMRWMERECYLIVNGNPTRRTPPQNPFCYYRRSGIYYASNFIHTPISFTHSISDALVPFSNSTKMADAINSYGPDQPVSVFADLFAAGCSSGPDYHCYEPDPEDVLDFLEKYTLKNNPTHINIVTDESKTFYWMKINQSGSERFSQVEVTVNKPGKTVTAVISDTTALPADGLSLDFNLGDNLIAEPLAGLAQPGIGLPENRTYLVKEQKGSSVITDTRSYTAGYFHVDLNSTDLVTVTISPVPENGNSDTVKVYLPIITKH